METRVASTSPVSSTSSAVCAPVSPRTSRTSRRTRGRTPVFGRHSLPVPFRASSVLSPGRRCGEGCAVTGGGEGQGVKTSPGRDGGPLEDCFVGVVG